jgi:hypothetical protein
LRPGAARQTEEQKENQQQGTKKISTNFEAEGNIAQI